MKIIKKVLRLCRLFLFAFMFAVCIVLGIAPVVPKRKEQYEIEVKMHENDKQVDTKETIISKTLVG